MVEEYITKETPLAAFLIASGFSLIEIRYEQNYHGKRQGFFVFEDTDQLKQSRNQYEAGEATVNLVMYEHIKQGLLDRIFGGLA